MDTMGDSEDPYEMPHYVSFHQGLHCLLRQKQSTEKEKKCSVTLSSNRSIYRMDRPDLIVSNVMQNLIDLKNSKRVSTANTTITHCRPFINVTVSKSHIHQGDN